ncbi:MAG: hypothetical protein O3C29_03415 [Proteobacteria bacterium]|nr:hypothetical protein [Pseudomonadota bacterium]MDA1290236.1 hypothetical protein [Pseudomonadota bacterium]
MTASRKEIGMYQAYSVLSASLLVAWFVYFIQYFNADFPVLVHWPFIIQISIVFFALLASIFQKPLVLLTFSIFVLFPLGLYTFSGEGLPKFIGALSVFCFVISIAITIVTRKSNAKLVHGGR